MQEKYNQKYKYKTSELLLNAFSMTVFLGVLFILFWCIWHHLFGFWWGQLIKIWDNQWKFLPKLLICAYFILRKDFITTYYHYQGLCKPTIKMFYILFFLLFRGAAVSQASQKHCQVYHDKDSVWEQWSQHYFLWFSCQPHWGSLWANKNTWSHFKMFLLATNVSRHR